MKNSFRKGRNDSSGKKYQRLPDFLCLGFQKSGTTTLFKILEQHSSVALCRDVKEPMYYRVLFLRRIGGTAFYRRRYYGHVLSNDPRVMGEVNAGLTFTHCAKKLCRDLRPDTKLIFMMREPVSRAYSAYKYFLARGYLDEWVVDLDAQSGHAVAFDRYVRSVLEDPSQRESIMRKRLKYLILSQSNYATCIEEYLKGFPLGQMKFILFEEFIKDQQKSCSEIFDFLGIPEDKNIDYGIRANEGNERPVSYRLAKKVQIAKGFDFGWYEFLMMPHWAPKTYKKFRNIYEHYRSRGMEPDHDRSKMLPETREYLQHYFNDEVRRLETIIGRDLHEIWF